MTTFARYTPQKTLVPSVNRQHPQAKGLIGFWPVLASDSSLRIRNLAGSANAISVNGLKKTTDPVTGVAAKLSGSENFVSTGSFPGNSVTYSTRIFLTAIGTGTTQNNELFQRDGDSTDWGFQFQFSGPKLIFYIVNQVPQALSLTGNSSLVINKWYHVAATYDISSQTCKLYVNGQLDGSSTLAATSIRGAATLYTIGATSINARRVTGNMDDMRVYNRALKDAEIMDIYRNPNAIFNNREIYYAADITVPPPSYDASQFFMIM